ncbi:MAG: hypothetical protein R3A52_05725 [Polyangiales bacterium]
MELLLMRAELETLDRAHREAVDALSAADAILRDAMRGPLTHDAHRRQHADVLLRLARARRLAGLDGVGTLDEARAVAESVGALALVAQCDAELAEAAELQGDRRAAVSAWRRAALNARAAGDAGLEQQFEERLRRLTRFEPAPA